MIFTFDKVIFFFTSLNYIHVRANVLKIISLCNLRQIKVLHFKVSNTKYHVTVNMFKSTYN